MYLFITFGRRQDHLFSGADMYIFSNLIGVLKLLICVNKECKNNYASNRKRTNGVKAQYFKINFH